LRLPQLKQHGDQRLQYFTRLFEEVQTGNLASILEIRGRKGEKV
jgi:hypothetical protein